ncbi:MAG: FAD-dependent oxidoreductase [Planctomycetes bacterium]|nr:FAD-dependent oxidoreductase [Planctomycetota bacterium]
MTVTPGGATLEIPSEDLVPQQQSPNTAPTPRETRCAIVGGGPSGLILGLLLARQAVPVTVLEAHQDFDRDFRGDTIHSSTLEMLEQIGLAGKLHELPHSKIRQMKVITPDSVHTLARFDRLPTRFPYVMVMPQSRFLEFIADEARRYPQFELLMGANVQRLIEEETALTPALSQRAQRERESVVRGVHYRTRDSEGEIRADLTVAADGRFSKIRKLAALEPVSQSPEIDIVWFRLPRREEDPFEEGEIHAGCGGLMVLLVRQEQWQCGFVIRKGGYQQLRAAGLESLRERVAALVPWLADRVGLLDDWKDLNVLSVESSRLTRWHKPGLLLIGDAAHVMSPVGGLGINYAIGDAVEAANVLANKLRGGTVDEAALAEVQRRREWPVRVAQRVQRMMQHLLVDQTLDTSHTFRVPLPLRALLHVPVLRDFPARVAALGARRVRVEQPEPVAAGI